MHTMLEMETLLIKVSPNKFLIMPRHLILVSV